MELLQLKYFCYAAECESFSKTAKHFYVPASGISRTIKRLEEELKTPLFTRTANKIIINEQGKIFYKKVKNALLIIDDAKLQLGYMDDTVKGEIKILILANRRIITGAIEKFRAKYKDVNFIIYHSCYANAKDFDIIVSAEDIKENFEKKLLLTEDIVLAMSKENILCEKDKISPKDLKMQKYITMSNGSSLYAQSKRICENMGFDPTIVIQTDDPFYVRKYVEINMGVAFIPQISWKGLFSDNIIFKKAGNHKRKTYIFFNKEKYINKATKLFAEMLSEYVKNKE